MVKLPLELDRLISCILRKAALSLRGLDRAHVDLCFVGPAAPLYPGNWGSNTELYSLRREWKSALTD